MSCNELKAIKSEAKAVGILWKDVEAVYRELRAIDEESRVRDHEIREMVWRLYCPNPAHYRWWRYGFVQKFAKAFDGGDYDIIPDFDVVASNVAESFPEFQCEDVAQAVWDYLQEDYFRRANRIDLYREAVELVKQAETAAVADDEMSFDFGFNATF